MAGPLGKLVHLTSLDVRGTWHGKVGCVSRVCMHVRVCVGGCGSVKLCGYREGVGVCVCGHQAMGWLQRGQQQHWRVRWASWCT